MNYAKACEEYERRRGFGKPARLAQIGDNFVTTPITVYPLIGTAIRVGCAYWEASFGKPREFPEWEQMPIRFRNRESFVAEIKARREVLGS